MTKKFRWSANLAYAAGLITTDGCLSADGRHIDLTSKDIDQLRTFSKILRLKCKIGTKTSGSSDKIYYRVQFSNVIFYKFLLKIGLTPHKSKTLGKIIIPDMYFKDFLRGHLDGDGCIFSYWDPRWKNSYMFYTYFMSASEEHLMWLKETILRLYNINGRISYHNRSYYHLRFAKNTSLQLWKQIYYKDNLPYLFRKYFKMRQALGIISKQAGVEKLVDSLD